jgi:hypothetical protein
MFDDLEKPCPICGKAVKPFEGQVLASGEFMLYKYECVPCKWPFVQRVEARPKVEGLVGFNRPPSRWEK